MEVHEEQVSAPVTGDATAKLSAAIYLVSKRHLP